ncbi:MAG: PspA/IM30 family protein [bacterium]
MSILDRLNLLIRSEINDVARPDRMRSAVSDMESSLREARQQQARLRQDEKKLIAMIREGRSKISTWEDRAVLALKSGQEDLAKEALVMKNRATQEVETLRDRLDEHRSAIKDIERALEALELKLDGTRGRISNTGRTSPSSESAWDAEFRRRVGNKDAAAVADEPGTAHSRAFDAFDRMADKIRSFEASVSAADELDDDDPLVDPKRKRVERSFEELESRKRNEDGLASLKQKNDDLADLKKKFSE